jgi:methylated-DNA-[protein]-cysteine S-methyltransferase
MTIDATTVTTPVGGLALLARDGALVAAGFADIEAMHARIGAEPIVARADLGELSRGVAAYFDGDLAALDDLLVAQPGGAFRQEAWTAMRRVPPGQTISYTKLAAEAGNPKAVRAAASACAQNLIAPIVPCHRVLRSDGSLGGYYYGLPVKQWLLDHERRHGQVEPHETGRA